MCKLLQQLLSSASTAQLQQTLISYTNNLPVQCGTKILYSYGEKCKLFMSAPFMLAKLTMGNI